MKNTINKSLFLLCLLVFAAACGGSGQQEEKKEFTIVDFYLDLKDALVETDAERAKNAAYALREVSSNDDFTASLDIIAETEDIAIQRAAFEDISKFVYQIVKTEGHATTLYKQYCPMAFDNKGAYWLAAEEEVNNPYFGWMMLHCGSVQETIEKAN